MAFTEKIRKCLRMALGSIKTAEQLEADIIAVATNEIADGAVDTAELVNEAVTIGKMADLARGSIIAGNATDRPAALNCKGAGNTLIGTGVDVTAGTFSNHATLAANGDVTLQNVPLTALPNLNRGSVWAGDATPDRPAPVDFSPLGQVPQGDAADLLSVPVTGDFTINGAGVTTIGNTMVTLGMMADIAQGSIYTGGPLDAVTALSHAAAGSILTGNGTGVVCVVPNTDMVLAAGGGVTIQPGVVSIGKLANAAKIQTSTFPIQPVFIGAPGGANATYTSAHGFVCPADVTILSMIIQWSAAIAIGDANNCYIFNVVNGANELLSAGVNSFTLGGILQWVPTTLTVNQNANAVAGDVILCRAYMRDDVGAGPTNLVAQTCYVTVNYRLR